MSEKTNKLSSRVDFQVTFLTSIISLCSSLLIFFFCYQITYGSTIRSLEDRAMYLCQAVERVLDMETFHSINEEEDMDSQLYQESHRLLENLKDAAGVLYLYTAKATEEGELIYVIDGLSMEEDFRYPGDPIEEAIQEKLWRALDGEYIVPKNILHTDWGDIFITYFPIHDQNNQIIGVVGMEFEAGDTYRTYNLLTLVAPLICIVFCLFAAVISSRAFRRVSNPLYKDMANTDAPTGLKNRNAFEVDMANLRNGKNLENFGIIVADLNDLKYVNDHFGHNRGDDYIRLAAEAIQKMKTSNMATYRVGGDEFAVIAKDATLQQMEAFVQACSTIFQDQLAFRDFTPSMACGWGIFDPSQDKDLSDTYRRADEWMYERKQKTKEMQKAEQKDQETEN